MKDKQLDYPLDNIDTQIESAGPKKDKTRPERQPS